MHLNLRGKMLLTPLAALLLAFFVSGFLILQKTDQALLDNEDAEISLTTSVLSELFYHHLEHARNELKSVLVDEELREAYFVARIEDDFDDLDRVLKHGMQISEASETLLIHSTKEILYRSSPENPDYTPLLEKQINLILKHTPIIDYQQQLDNVIYARLFPYQDQLMLATLGPLLDVEDIIGVVVYIKPLNKDLVFSLKEAIHQRFFGGNYRVDVSLALSDRVLVSTLTHMQLPNTLLEGENTFDLEVNNRPFRHLFFSLSVSEGFLGLSYDISENNDVRTSIQIIMLLILAMAMGLMYIVILLNANWITQSIQKVINYATQVSSNQPIQRITTTSKDEIGQLIRVVNTMGDRVAVRETELIDSNTQLENEIVERKNEIVERKKLEEKLRFQAGYDFLTGLPNRLLFHNRLSELLSYSARHGKRLALLFIDLDHFKIINDARGHSAGDELLKESAVRLSKTLRKSDIVARLGGDEFTVILPDITGPFIVESVAQKILDALSRPFMISDIESFISASIGITLYPDDGLSQEELISNADHAMYQAKDSGRNAFAFFTAEMNLKAVERVNIESDMRKALEREEFVLHYQPKMDIRTNQIVSMEVLVRWQHPEKGLIPPFKFIPIAEESGLIVPLGLWILEKACYQTKLWLDMGFDSLRVAVNMSPYQFKRTDIVKMLKKAMGKSQLPSKNLEIEITESMMMENVEKSIEDLNQVRDLGIHIAVDDFGVGYSSLTYLKKFPINTLKIDQSFVRDITNDDDDSAIVSAIINMAHSLGLEVVAEGVETLDHQKILRKKKCYIIQGYYYSRPVPAEEFTKLLIHYRDLKIK